jgi:uncharacterized protein RhaS with RHS repeats
MRRHQCGLSIILCVALALTACAARPRTRPLHTTPIAEGPNTMEAARKALEGRWVLIALNVTSADGPSAVVDATGTLTSDAFGNLHIEFRMSETGQKTLERLGIKSPDPVISTTGQVVIDPQQRQITYVGEGFDKRASGFDPDLAARRTNPFALERTRYYVLGADAVLTLSTRHDNGKDAAVSRWKKGS